MLLRIQAEHWEWYGVTPIMCEQNYGQTGATSNTKSNAIVMPFQVMRIGNTTAGINSCMCWKKKARCTCIIFILITIWKVCTIVWRFFMASKPEQVSVWQLEATVSGNTYFHNTSQQNSTHPWKWQDITKVISHSVIHVDNAELRLFVWDLLGLHLC